MKKHTNRFILLLVSVLLLSGCGQRETAPVTDTVDVTAQVTEAEKLYQAGSYESSLEEYLNAMETDPKNMDARIGVVNCQIALERYELALMNLEMAQQIDPDNMEICRAYLQMNKQTEKIAYAQLAVELAEKYDHKEILVMVPSKPVFAAEAGSYDSRITLEITADPDTEVYVSLDNDVLPDHNRYDVLYTGPIELVRGTNTVTAYTLKDGIPSASVKQVYRIDYPCVNVEFQEPLMEELALQALGKPSGPVTNYECETITELSWYDLQMVYTSYREFEALRISTLEDLNHFPSLYYLFLYNQNKITDYSPLAYCPLLFQVGIEDCGLRDTDFARYCPGVEHFNLGGNRITDISGLVNKEMLYGVAFRSNRGSIDIEALIEAHPEMYRLEIDTDMLTDYSVLLKLDALTNLSVDGLANVDTAGLSQLKDLTYLQISMDYNADEYDLTLEDLSFLQNMPKLENLDLNGVSRPEDLEYIAQLQNLRYLYLYDCPVSSNTEAMQNLINRLPNCNINF